MDSDYDKPSEDMTGKELDRDWRTESLSLPRRDPMPFRHKVNATILIILAPLLLLYIMHSGVADMENPVSRFTGWSLFAFLIIWPIMIYTMTKTVAISMKRKYQRLRRDYIKRMDAFHGTRRRKGETAKDFYLRATREERE